MSKGSARWLTLLEGIILGLVSLSYLQANGARTKAVYGDVPGSWMLNGKGFREKFVPKPGYGGGVYAVQGMSAESILALDTNGESFAQCRRLPEGSTAAEPIPTPNCYPEGPRCTAYPYKCSSELSAPVFIETELKPTSSERLKWSDSVNPKSAFRPIGNSTKGTPFYFERSCTPKALAGKILFHGAWLTGPNEFAPEGDESYPASVYDQYGRALYFRESSGIKFLSEPAANLGEASAYEPVTKSNYRWAGEPDSAPLHDQPQYYPFSKIYTVPGGFWLEIDWKADHEGAGASLNTQILQIIDGKASEFAVAEKTRMY